MSKKIEDTARFQKLITTCTARIPKESKDEQWRTVIANFGCQKKNVVNLLTLMGFGDQVKDLADETKTQMIRFSALVPTANSCGHDYKIGVPVLVVKPHEDGTAVCLKKRGEMGNYLNRTDCRPATAEEIALVAEYPLLSDLRADVESIFTMADEIAKAI